MIKIQLRTDSFMFLRKQPVNLARYLPYWLYSDEIFAKVQAALNREHNAYRLKLIETAKQFFFQTADSDGLKDWELFLKIPNVKEKGLELRRSVVKTKLLRNVVMTVENTKKLLREFAPYGEVDIEELGNNELNLIIHNGNFEYEELFPALYEWLPAHLTFGFSSWEDFGNEEVRYAQALADATHYDFLLDMLSPPPATITISITPVDIGETTFYPDSADSHSEHKDNIKYAILEQQSISMTIDCDRSELDDEQTLEDFERYIRMRWAQFKTNPVVKWYKHGNKGLDGEIENPDDEEIFPIDTDFLRLYFTMQDSDSIRYLTILHPRLDVDGREINALSLKSKNLLLSRKGFLSDKIIRALYVKKTETKII